MLPKNWVRPSTPYQASLKVDSYGSFWGNIIRPDGLGKVPISGLLDPVSGFRQGYRCADGKWLFLVLTPQKTGALQFQLVEDSGGYTARTSLMRFVAPPGTYQELLAWDSTNPVPTYPDYAFIPPELVGKPMPLPMYFGRLTVTATTSGAFSLTMEGLQALETESSPIKVSEFGAFDGSGQWQKTVTDEKGTQFTLKMKCMQTPGFTATVTVYPKGVKKPLSASATFTQPAQLATVDDVSGSSRRRYTIAMEPGAYVGDGPTFDALNPKDRVVGGYGTLIPIGTGQQWVFTGKLSSGATFSSTTYCKKVDARSEDFAVFANGIAGASLRNYQLLGKLPLGPGQDCQPFAYGSLDPIKGGLFLSTSYLYPRTNAASQFYWGQNLEVAASSWNPQKAAAWNFLRPDDGGVFVYGIEGSPFNMRVTAPYGKPPSASLYEPGLGDFTPSAGKITITEEGVFKLEYKQKTYSGVWLPRQAAVVGFEDSGTSAVWAPIRILPATNP